MHSECTEVLVIGGGVVGMTTALALADAGWSVELCEAGALGQEASWAGGGIMMPLYAWRFPRELDLLLQRSLDEMSRLVARLKAQTGIDPELHPCGMWVRGLADQERQQALDWAARCEWPVAEACYTDLIAQGKHVAQRKHAVELPVSPTSDLWFPNVSNVRNPRLLKALAVMLAQHPRVRVSTFTPVQGVEATDQGLKVMLDGQNRLARHVVCAAGAWSTRVLQNLTTNVLKVRPVMGQMLSLKYANSEAIPMVLQNGLYIVPRKKGLVLVGSTVQRCGYRKQWDVQTYHRLLNFAVDLLGETVRQTVQAQWSGLRPEADRDLPVVGAHPTVPGLWFNTGHFRNGLVLAVGSAQHLVQHMNQGWAHSVSANPLGLALRTNAADVTGATVL